MAQRERERERENKIKFKFIQGSSKMLFNIFYVKAICIHLNHTVKLVNLAVLSENQKHFTQMIFFSLSSIFLLTLVI